MTNKTVTLELVGLDGNAFFLMGAFSRQARREGWTQGEINEVLTDCKSGDYDHLLQVLIKHCESPGPDAENEDFVEWNDHDEEDLDHFDEDPLKELATKLGVTQSAIIEIAIRRLAETEKVQ